MRYSASLTYKWLPLRVVLLISTAAVAEKGHVMHPFCEVSGIAMTAEKGHAIHAFILRRASHSYDGGDESCHSAKCIA